MKNKKPPKWSFYRSSPRDIEIETMYPDKKARDYADAVLDSLPDATTTLVEACRAWDMAYCEVDPKGNRVIRK